ncbi:hypothetical protein Tco_0366534 [Tanacetum coccineum]
MNHPLFATWLQNQSLAIDLSCASLDHHLSHRCCLEGGEIAKLATLIGLGFSGEGKDALSMVSYKSKKGKKTKEVQEATNVQVETLYVQRRSEQKNSTAERYLDEAKPATKEAKPATKEAKPAKEETRPAAKEEGKDDKK